MKMVKKGLAFILLSLSLSLSVGCVRQRGESASGTVEE